MFRLVPITCARQKSYLLHSACLQIARMSQQNSRTVDELAAAAQRLDSVARSMQSSVLQFQT